MEVNSQQVVNDNAKVPNQYHCVVNIEEQAPSRCLKLPKFCDVQAE